MYLIDNGQLIIKKSTAMALRSQGKRREKVIFSIHLW